MLLNGGAGRPTTLSIFRTITFSCNSVSIPRKFACQEQSRAFSQGAGATWEERLLLKNPHNNIPPHIAALVGRDLHLIKSHPLGIIKEKIVKFFVSRDAGFISRDSMDPIVTTKQCFDDLLIPSDHQSRKASDTYYIDKERLLRTHTSAHQTELLSSGLHKFLCTGDVYRRDEIDASHYPAFHQMEGVKIIELCDGMKDRSQWVDVCQKDLKADLEAMIDSIFGPVKKRWVDAYFPFTDPSFELEIFFNGEWLEVLGCGVVQQRILESCGMGHRHGWAFGLGLERLAMVLFEIPDIRLFWTKDERFLSQFREGVITKFQPFSKYPPCYKDITFWIPEGFEENSFMEAVRGVAGDYAESVALIDKFDDKKNNRTSHCYRINYRAMDRSLTNKQVDVMQEALRKDIADTLNCKLR